MPNGERTTADILRATKPWVRFMSILGFISAGLMLIGGLIMAGVGLATENLEVFVTFAFYPLLALLYIFPSLFLFRYASHIANFLRDGQPDQLNAALEAQKSFWKFVGIMMIVLLVLYALLLLGLILAAIVAVGAASA